MDGPGDRIGYQRYVAVTLRIPLQPYFFDLLTEEHRIGDSVFGQRPQRFRQIIVDKLWRTEGEQNQSSRPGVQRIGAVSIGIGQRRDRNPRLHARYRNRTHSLTFSDLDEPVDSVRRGPHEGFARREKWVVAQI